MERIDWQSTPISFIPAVACPKCQAMRPLTMRSIDQGDLSRLKLHVCRKCSTRFRTVIEPPGESFPDFGKLDMPTP